MAEVNDDKKSMTGKASASEVEVEFVPEEQWGSRASFILAAVGSAIGLGNFWRFPFLCFRWGGGTFFIPYLVALIFVGIPLIQLEMGVGQVFRRAATQAFAGLDKRFRGIGLAAGFLAFVILGYYMVIIGWANVYFIQSFQATEDIPWSIYGIKGKAALGPPQAYFFDEVIHIGSPDPLKIDKILWDVVAGAMFMWIIVLVILYKGSETVGKAVYITVLLPVGMLIVLFIVGISLPGSGKGIEQYIGRWDMSLLSEGDMWVDAFGQIFFSLSLSTGVMSAYGSLNPRNNDIVKDAAIVALLNCTFSFIAGFAVFTIVGYLSETTNLSFKELQGVLGGPTLAFRTYPSALTLISTSAWVNILCMLFFLMLFFLGVDSAFSLVDAVVLNYRETELFGRFSRLQMTGGVCFLGACCTMFYCTDIGLFLLDILDDYVSLGLLLVGFSESVVAGWFYKRDEVIEIVGATSNMLFEIGTVGGFLVFSVISLLLSYESDLEFGPNFGISFAVSVVILIAGVAGANKTGLGDSPLSVLAFHGPDSLCETLNAVVTEGKPNNLRFGRAWGMCLKFFMTPVVCYLMFLRAASRMKTGGYDGYVPFLQQLGMAIIAICLLFIAVGFVKPDVFRPRTKA